MQISLSRSKFDFDIHDCFSSGRRILALPTNTVLMLLRRVGSPPLCRGNSGDKQSGLVFSLPIHTAQLSQSGLRYTIQASRALWLLCVLAAGDRSSSLLPRQTYLLTLKAIYTTVLMGKTTRRIHAYEYYQPLLGLLAPKTLRSTTDHGPA